MKRPRLSLSLKNRRFASPLTANEMRKVCEGFTPQNRTKNTDWSPHVFQEWQKKRDGGMVISALRISWNVLLLKSMTTGFPVSSLNAGE